MTKTAGKKKSLREILNEVYQAGWNKNTECIDQAIKEIQELSTPRLTEYCKCERTYAPGEVIECDKVNPPTCAKCHKEIKMSEPRLMEECPASHKHVLVDGERWCIQCDKPICTGKKPSVREEHKGLNDQKGR